MVVCTWKTIFEVLDMTFPKDLAFFYAGVGHSPGAVSGMRYRRVSAPGGEESLAYQTGQ